MVGESAFIPSRPVATLPPLPPPPPAPTRRSRAFGTPAAVAARRPRFFSSAIAARQTTDGRAKGIGSSRLLRALLVIAPSAALLAPGAWMAGQITGRATLASKAGYIFHRNFQENPDEFYFRLTPDGSRLRFEEMVLGGEDAPRLDPAAYPASLVLLSEVNPCK